MCRFPDIEALTPAWIATGFVYWFTPVPWPVAALLVMVLFGEGGSLDGTDALVFLCATASLHFLLGFVAYKLWRRRTWLGGGIALLLAVGAAAATPPAFGHYGVLRRAFQERSAPAVGAAREICRQDEWRLDPPLHDGGPRPPAGWSIVIQAYRSRGIGLLDGECGVQELPRPTLRDAVPFQVSADGAAWRNYRDQTEIASPGGRFDLSGPKPLLSDDLAEQVKLTVREGRLHLVRRRLSSSEETVSKIDYEVRYAASLRLLSFDRESGRLWIHDGSHRVQRLALDEGLLESLDVPEAWEDFAVRVSPRGATILREDEWSAVSWSGPSGSGRWEEPLGWRIFSKSLSPDHSYLALGIGYPGSWFNKLESLTVIRLADGEVVYRRYFSKRLHGGPEFVGPDRVAVPDETGVLVIELAPCSLSLPTHCQSALESPARR